MESSFNTSPRFYHHHILHFLDVLERKKNPSSDVVIDWHSWHNINTACTLHRIFFLRFLLCFNHAIIAHCRCRIVVVDNCRCCHIVVVDNPLPLPGPTWPHPLFFFEVFFCVDHPVTAPAIPSPFPQGSAAHFWVPPSPRGAQLPSLARPCFWRFLCPRGLICNLFSISPPFFSQPVRGLSPTSIVGQPFR